MKTYEVTSEQFDFLRLRLSGWVFHRVDENGRLLMRPFGRLADSIVQATGGKEIELED